MKSSVSILIITIGFIGLMFLLSNNKGPSGAPVESSIIDGQSQIIELTAKGGYSPRVISAKAGIPTVLKVNTKGTFDCSAALSIPSLGYRAILPQSGTTEIQIPPQESGKTIQGLCQMGMYNFEIRFN